MDGGRALLRLPPELRVHIYHFVAAHDRLNVVANRHLSPPMLHTCRQLRNEYRNVFFFEDLFGLSEYFEETGCWCIVADKGERMDLFLRAHLVDMAAFANSHAGAQRFCQKHVGIPSDRRQGIVTLNINGAPRYWMWWTCPPADD